MAELVDAHGSGPCAFGCGGSSPLLGTMVIKPNLSRSFQNYSGYFASSAFPFALISSSISIFPLLSTNEIWKPYAGKTLDMKQSLLELNLIQVFTIILIPNRFPTEQSLHRSPPIPGFALMSFFIIVIINPAVQIFLRRLQVIV